MTDYRNSPINEPKVPTIWITETEAKEHQLCRQCSYPMEEKVSAAGKIYWACKRLPGCKTHVMISTFAKKRPGEASACVPAFYGNPDGHVNPPPPPPDSKIARLSPDAPRDEPMTDVARGGVNLMRRLDKMAALLDSAEDQLRLVIALVAETRADPAVRAATFVSRQ